MNRLILKYAVPVVIVILVIFAWVVYRRLASGWHDIVPLAVAAAVVWVAGTVVFIVFWPRITIGGFKRAILKRGMGDGPIPVNTLYAAPRTSSASAAGGSLLATGTDDVLYVAGWLDVTRGPQVLHTPTWRIATSACSSPTRRRARTSPTWERGRPAAVRGTT
ncbi:DUF1254 domain-containing protein [Microbacterium elymi]|uniref:DUF1254 domain-containing protein n=1 Tax=Microbacterium elymi TaxID=2909587 RepID=A0ABY5NIZ5_9MICO|nr:DUF1254 domain-containing protein [Microbacterium elymi]UUT35157.1 DUF1254 domain-containing protein [Microbacterium elymi]